VFSPLPLAGEVARRAGEGFLTLPLNYWLHHSQSDHPMAFDPRLIDELARRLAGSVPESVVALRRDLEANFKGVLQAQLAKLDLVTREEFDVQANVLKRTRAKLTALEKRLAELEGK
jgi:BMFP domain-containing protein YqiC